MKSLPPRYVTLLWIAGTFLAINTLVRVGLLVFEGGVENLWPARLIEIFAVGAVYDIAALCYVLPVFALIALAWPNNSWGRTGHAVSASGLFALALFGMLFTAVSEFIFWNEFSSRFNFIAVDYLIYTREVIGNIRESYPVGTILSVIAAVAVGLFFAVRKPFWRAAQADASSLRRRIAVTAVTSMLPLLSFWAIGDNMRERIASPSARELAGDGYYEFLRAFRNNDLDYRAFYRNLPLEEARPELRAHFPGMEWPGPLAIEHKVKAAGHIKPLNVVLVSIESLGADFVESFGGRKGLTPNLDRIAAHGLMFTNLYATGLRTVRGLEALTLSVPPTPGHAVPMRKNNKGLQTLGGVFRDNGYESLYLYGGYSYFDNMQDFFGGNGYTVIDRTAIAKEDISHETIWGVADEDLFRLALREIDRRAEAGKKVFAHIMTTSNHRPFTYPAGRIDIAPGHGRDGAVKYTDWAIGRFVEEAARRPWFKHTLFVFIADHTSHGRGRTDLPPENFRIPMIIYAPGIVRPRRVDTLASQIDVAPTVLALLNVTYTSHFFGHNVLAEGRQDPRAFFANYLTVGMLRDGMVVELSPKRHVRVVDAATGKPLPGNEVGAESAVREAIANYEIAAEMLRVNRFDHSLTTASAPHE